MGKINLVLYGASGHAKVIEEAAGNEQVIRGFFDDDTSKKNFRNLRVHAYSAELYQDACCIVSIGDNTLRKRISLKITHQFATVLATTAQISPSASIGLGTFVAQQAVIQAETKIGNHCIINTNASVDHDCFVADYVHVAPGVTVCGGVSIDEGTLVGAGTVILPNIKIGKWCIIGAGSVVTKNISDYSAVKGNPAK